MKRKYWSAEEVELLRQRYAGTPTPELAATLGRPASRVLAKANAMGLYKSKDLIATISRERSARPGHPSQAYRFAKGIVPWNKGVEGSTGHHPNTRAAQFKKGNKPHTWVPVGTFRVNNRMLEIKYSDDPGGPSARWKFYGRHVWEQAHGPVPAGHLVVFKPGRASTDPEAVTLDAVELITRRQIMERNTVHRMPPELARATQLRGALNRTINRLTKQAQQPEEEPTP